MGIPLIHHQPLELIITFYLYQYSFGKRWVRHQMTIMTLLSLFILYYIFPSIAITLRYNTVIVIIIIFIIYLVLQQLSKRT